MSDSTLSGKGRMAFLEAMKALCVFSVFIFHCTRVFDADDWHVKDPNPTAISSFYLYELGMAIMPGFFFVSGASVWFSMQKRSAPILLKNILKRFLLPLAFGCTILDCFQIYLERITHGQFEGSFFQFIPHYFNGWYGFGGNFAWFGLHLWYLVLLFVYTLILLPFFIIGKKILEKPFVQKFTGSPLLVLLFALAVVYPGWKLHINSMWGGRMWGGWNLFENILFFGFGFVFFSNLRLVEKISKIKWMALATAVSLTALCLYWYQTNQEPAFRSPFFTFKLLVRSLACWSWIMAILGITNQYFNSQSKRLQYISQIVFPFYLFNQPFILLIAFYVTRWNITMPVKLAIIAIGSFVCTVALYELVKKVSFLRWLFGIPEKKAVKKINNFLTGVKLIPNLDVRPVPTQEK